MSTIIADNLTGKTAAGNVTVTSEGGAATFQLQQGLAKAWANLNGSTFGLRGNNNISSATDNGTGDYTFTFSSTMDNSDYSFTIGHRGAADNDTDDTPSLKSGTSATGSSIRIICNNQSLGTLRDVDYVCMAFHGDLA
jgi:hypothetical protein